MGDVRKPFDKYPEDGSKLLPKMGGGNARHEYGLKLQRLTKQTSCAYCGVSLVDDYYHWLLLCVDHVVPQAECRRLGIPDDLFNSYSNMVCCCSGCNGLKNRDPVRLDEPGGAWTVERFFQLRNRVFSERKVKILKRRAEEMSFFQGHPWEQ